jgi:putative hemolysin
LLALVVLILTSLVLGELLPKEWDLTTQKPLQNIAMPMKIISQVTAFIWLLTISTDFLFKLFQIKPTADGKVTKKKLKLSLKEGTSW